MSLAVQRVALVLALGAGGSAQAAPSDEQLTTAITRFEELDDQAALAMLRTLLGQHPSREIAAKAHLYLGLIAINAFYADEARREFQQALRANPAIEPPRLASPKAKVAFAQARQEIAAELTAAPPEPAEARRMPASPPPVVTPEPAHAPPSERVSGRRAEYAESTSKPTTERAEGSRSHLLSLALGGAAVIATGLAIFGGAEVAHDVSLVNDANAHPGVVVSSQIAGAQSAAGPWAAGWVICAVVAAAAGTAAVVTW